MINSVAVSGAPAASSSDAAGAAGRLRGFMTWSITATFALSIRGGKI